MLLQMAYVLVAQFYFQCFSTNCLKSFLKGVKVWCINRRLNGDRTWMRIGKSRLKTKQNYQRKKEEERVSGEGISREESEKRRSLRAFIDARRGGEGGFGSGPGPCLDRLNRKGNVLECHFLSLLLVPQVWALLHGAGHCRIGPEDL